MKFVPIENFTRRYAVTKVAAFIESFEKAGIASAEVIWDKEYSSAGSCCNTLKKTLKRMKKDKVIWTETHAGHVYIYFVDKVKGEE